MYKPCRLTHGGGLPTDRVFPVPDVADDVALQTAQVYVGLQGEAGLQAQPAAKGQEQQQLRVAEGPRAQGHAVRQVLCTGRGHTGMNWGRQVVGRLHQD